MLRLTSLFVLLGLLVASAAARAESGVAPPPGCYNAPATWPMGGATLPANLPALLFVGAQYGNRAPRPIESYNVELRDGGGDVVPIAIERAGDYPFLTSTTTGHDQYFVRPQRALAVGPAVLSYLDDCGPMNPFLPPMLERREVRFTVGPAVTLPTRLGTARLKAAQGSGCEGRTLELEIELDPAVATLPLLRVVVRGPGAPLSPTFTRVGPNRLSIAVGALCGPVGRVGLLGPGTSDITLEGDIGATTALEPLVLGVTVDCGGDAGTCAPPDARPPDVVRDGPGGVIVPDAFKWEEAGVVPPGGGQPPAVPPDAGGLPPMLPDSVRADNDTPPSTVTPGGTPTTSRGCDCTTGGAPRTAGLPVLLVAGLGLLRSARRRHSTSSRRARGAE